MNRFALPSPFVTDPDQRRNNEALIDAANDVGRFILAGVGEPTITDPAGVGQVLVVPDGAAVFFRLDPAVGAAIYGYDGTNWTVII